MFSSRIWHANRAESQGSFACRIYKSVRGSKTRHQSRSSGYSLTDTTIATGLLGHVLCRWSPPLSFYCILDCCYGCSPSITSTGQHASGACVTVWLAKRKLPAAKLMLLQEAGGLRAVKVHQALTMYVMQGNKEEGGRGRVVVLLLLHFFLEALWWPTCMGAPISSPAQHRARLQHVCYCAADESGPLAQLE